MRDKQCICTPILLIITSLILATASGGSNDIRGVLEKQNQELKLGRIFAVWDRSLDNSIGNAFQEKNSTFAPNFATEISKCIEDRQYEIAENISQGKAIILNCFKTILMINILRYMVESHKPNVKLFNGFLELEKIPEDCEEVSENTEEANNCGNKYGRNLGGDKRKQYIRLYEKAMLKLVSERNRFNAYRNQTEKEREKLLNRINENSEAFLSEVIKSIGNEEAERTEEEKIKKEMADPKLLAVLDEVSKNYVLKLRFYPGIAARMMRSHNGGFTFDLEIEDPSEADNEEEEEEEEEKKEILGDEESTREIKDGSQFEDYDEEDNDSIRFKKYRSKGDKKKKKEKKKKAKKLKKILPYLLIPMLIQMTLLPFVFKKLFFLALKALFAGKMALILVGFNLLRNTCIKEDDDFQKIRVEHYGYRKGEEYGAWINGRSLQESLIMSALNENFFGGQNPVTS